MGQITKYVAEEVNKLQVVGQITKYVAEEVKML